MAVFIILSLVLHCALMERALGSTGRMGKFRAHQDKGRAGAGRKKQPPGEIGGGGGDADKQRVIKAGEADVGQPKVKVVTYDKDHSVLICGDGDFSFTRGMIQHRKTG